METPEYAAHVAVRAATYAIDKPYEYVIPQELLGDILPGMRVRVQFGQGNRRTDGIILDIHPLLRQKNIRYKPIIEVIDSLPVLSENLIKLALWLREQCFCTFFDIAKAMLPIGVWHTFDTSYFPKNREMYEQAKMRVADLKCGADIVDCIFNAADAFKNSDLNELFGENNVKKAIKALLDAELVAVSEHMSQRISDKTEKLVRLDVSEVEINAYIQKKKPRPCVVEVLKLLLNLQAATAKELCYFTGVTVAQLNTLKRNGIVSYERAEVYRRPKPEIISPKTEINLNDKQQEIYQQISADIGKNASCALLHGVTGSGKTLIYFKLIEKVISIGKTAILLVPEIALTPQLLEKVYSYFGDRTAIMHSALSEGERYDEWKRIKNGEVDVIVGTRSAVFAPISNIGIIILDEEHEDTYKSSSNPRYHARDAAKFRCVSESALLLLGSATPSVESMYYAKTGKYKLYELQERFNERPLPRVIISDLKKSISVGNGSAIGRELREELAQNIERGEQAILFLNRRGASKYVICDSCDEVPGCPNCSVPLVYHSKNSRLMCHHCGYSEPFVAKCPECGGRLKLVGFGTQKVEEELAELFPGIKTIRMDMDTTSGKASHEQLLNKFRDENIPVLIGTQMITKGLDFENVTLVGVLSADQAVFSESYKANENAFSLITQVVGRAGRGEKEGRAVIQTYLPNNSLIQAASEQDYYRFFNEELILREARGLPPFSNMFSIVVLADNELGAMNACLSIRTKMENALKSEYSELSARILGPTPAVIVKVSNKYRYKLIVSVINNKQSRDLISRVLRDFVNDKSNKNLSIVLDVNSIDF